MILYLFKVLKIQQSKTLRVNMTLKLCNLEIAWIFKILYLNKREKFIHAPNQI